MDLKFKDGVKRQDRVNARVQYIEGDMEGPEYEQFVRALEDVSISSDAFFPFRDSIDHATKLGVKFVAQPGGSVADEEVISACDQYGMTMAFTTTRLFHH